MQVKVSIVKHENVEVSSVKFIGQMYIEWVKSIKDVPNDSRPNTARRYGEEERELSWLSDDDNYHGSPTSSWVRKLTEEEVEIYNSFSVIKKVAINIDKQK